MCVCVCVCVSVNPRGTRRAKRYFPPHVVLRECVVFRRPASCIAFIGVFPFSGRHTLHVIAFNPNASLVELAAVTHSCRRPRNGSSTCRRNFSTAVSNFDQILIGLFPPRSIVLHASAEKSFFSIPSGNFNFTRTKMFIPSQSISRFCLRYINRSLLNIISFPISLAFFQRHTYLRNYL